MSEYTDKLIKDKIDSMNQGDRVELKLLGLQFQIFTKSLLIIMIIFLTSGIMLIQLGLFLIELNTLEFNIIGIGSIIFSLLFLLLSLLFPFIILKIMKYYEKERDKFIEERSKI